MRFGVLILVACMFFVVPVMAAERGVIIINPDGTVTESDAPKVAHPTVSTVEEASPEPEPVSMPVPKPAMGKKMPVVVKTAPRVEVKSEATPEMDPQAVHEAAKAKIIKHESESVFSNEPEAPVSAEPKSAKKVKSTTPHLKTVKPMKEPANKGAAVAPYSSSPQIKWNKSSKASKKPVKVETPVEPEPNPEQQTRGPVSREDALRAAIAVAPPFKRSTVLPGNYKGQPVYEVILQTEDGEQSILIDTMTGDVIKAK